MTEALAVRPEESPATDPVMDTAAADESVSNQAVRDQLDRILQSRAFARSPRISRFLSFVVQQTLDGLEDKLKEYLLGVEVFGRQESFDPRIDSIVRVEARRLRYKLDKYYETEGREDQVHIQFRKGCYVPAFSRKTNGMDLCTDSSDVPYVLTVDNPHAFALFAKGRSHLSRWNSDGIAESVSNFSHALDEDLGCVAAQAGLGTAYLLAAVLGVMPARDVMPKAKAAAAKAISLTPDCAEAQAVSAFCSATYDWEWKESELNLRRSLHMNPCDCSPRLWLALYLTFMGRYDEAVREARRAQQASPTMIPAHLAVGLACHAAGAHDEALMQYRLAQELEPSLYAPYLATGLLLADQEMYEQALHSLTKARQLSPHNPWVVAASAYANGRAGKMDAARECYAELSSSGNGQYLPPLARAMAAASIHDMDEAFERMEEAMVERSPWLPLFGFATIFAGLRNDPRGQRLLERMRLVEPAAEPVASVANDLN